MSKKQYITPLLFCPPKKLENIKKNRTFVSISNTNKHNENINTIKNNGL